MEHKLEFAQRLRDAMEAAGLEPRPGVLLNVFNAHYWGRSVSFQAASRWLRGEAIPAQDKLLVLAEILRVEPEVLRFGVAVRQSDSRRLRGGRGLAVAAVTISLITLAVIALSVAAYALIVAYLEI